MKKLLVGVSGLAMICFAGSAMAQTATPASSNVNVNIQILPVVSLWGDDASLVLDGSNPPNNSAAVASQLHYINNVEANIKASVSGLPAADPGEGIQFHIFGNSNNTANALAAIAANGYTPAGAISFNDDNQATAQTLTANTGVNTNIHDQDIVYAANLPGDLPEPDTFTAVVTYTITDNP
jgi:hypothetical protein